MRLLFLTLATFGVAAAGQGRDVNARCRRPCEALVGEARLRASLCARCGLDQDPAWYLLQLREVPAAAFTDEDWEVRWGAVRADARARGLQPERRLAQWVEQSRGDERTSACLTALLAAGTRDTRRDALLAAEPKALAACKGVEAAVIAECTRELRQADVARALQALQGAAAGRGVGSARVVLDAMTAQPSEADEGLARLMVANAERGGPPVGLALLREATAADAPRVDRLLAIFAATRDRNRPLLSSTEKEARRQAVVALAPLAPLSLSELTTALDDEQASIRLAAARAIARGEGRTLTEAAAARLSGRTKASAAEKRRWLVLLSDVDDPVCAQLTRGTWRDATQPDAVRADALVSLAGCAGRQALTDLSAAAAAGNVTLEAGAMRAVLLLPREPGVAPLVEAALASSADEVLAGAIVAIAAHRLSPLAPRVEPLTGHRAASVRAAALDALFTLDPRKYQPLVVTALGQDEEAPVRVTAAKLLASAGGPLAVSALARASRRDPDDRVKVAAVEGLRRLGVTP
ncbi:MAG: HEAT repeat domain-containing protein [Myxococcaceae bacterium]|nr:HEAT repeat domain-containing protein [Myxococcaceae bacterium]MCA3010762.1 HEAT repeat domain-containing protein [Myxococcaceae bacterium]